MWVASGYRFVLLPLSDKVFATYAERLRWRIARQGPLGRCSGFPPTQLPARLQGLTRPEAPSGSARLRLRPKSRNPPRPWLHDPLPGPCVAGAAGPCRRPSGPGPAHAPAPRPGTVPAAPWHGASAGSHAGGAWLPAMIHTRHGAWIFCTWRPGSGGGNRPGCVQGSDQPWERAVPPRGGQFRGIRHVPQGPPASAPRPMRAYGNSPQPRKE